MTLTEHLLKVIYIMSTDDAVRHVLAPGSAAVPLLDAGLRRHLRRRRRLLVPLHRIQLTTGWENQL